MRFGVIGTGNMGGMLAKGLATRGSVDVMIYNRTQFKAESLLADCPKLQLACNIPDLIRKSDVIIISTKANDGIEIMKTWGPMFSPTQTIVTTISSVPNQTWETMTPAKVAKVIPSITQSAQSGVLLVTYGERVDEQTRHQLDKCFKTFSTPFEICEEQIRVASDLASCGPAFISYLFMQWAEAAAETNRISAQDAQYLLTETLIGTADLLRNGLTLSDIVTKVTTKGGVTESGISILQLLCRNVFYQLHESTSRHSHFAKKEPTLTKSSDDRECDIS